MADVTGFTRPTNASPFDVPGDINKLADHFGDPGMFSVPDAASLPAAGNWPGRLLTVADTGAIYKYNGTAWEMIYRPEESTTATPGSGWGTPTHNTLFRRYEWVEFRFNATRTSNLATGGTVATIPAGYRTNVQVWALAWGLSGAGVANQVYYDSASNQVKVNNALSSGQALAIYMLWRQTS